VTRRAGNSEALLERRLPALSEHASIVALANFRALIRAPEAKMVLLSPVIMIVVFGGMFLTRPGNPNEFLRPVMAAGAMTFLLFMLVGLAGNLFGFDRAGFRAFVLSPVSRRDILLGKNLSLVPFAIALMTLAVVLMQVVRPMRADHLIALSLQMIPMYLLYCLVGNFLSIIAPMAMKSGSLAPARPKGMKMLVHLAFVPMFPLTLAPTLIPLGIEFLLNWAGWWTWFPAYLVFTLAELAVAAYVYARVLNWQGDILQRREQGILEIVTAKSE
jgi:sorbitol-specific phosphotransferase system component IIC